MLGEPGPCVKFARMPEDVAAAGFVDVQAHHLPADGTLRHQRMKPLPSEQLDEFDNPNG